jgi:hypothetical protein
VTASRTRCWFEAGHPLGASSFCGRGWHELKAGVAEIRNLRFVTVKKTEACETLRFVDTTGDPARRPLLMADLNDADLAAEAETEPGRAGPHRWTRDEAREAARLSKESRATRRDREPPSDDDIERGLRERAVSDPRAAEILLRWQQRPRPASDGDELEGLTVEQLEALHAALLRLSALTPGEQSTVLQGLLDGRV